MGYMHPMDDGQERTFKVKFEGEGVDDYGGPYREVFAQIPLELQAFKRSEDVRNACCLPVFQPTPNTLIDKDTDSPKFLLRPNIIAPMYLELCNFLGQFVGMALRSQANPRCYQQVQYSSSSHRSRCRLSFLPSFGKRSLEVLSKETSKVSITMPM